MKNVHLLQTETYPAKLQLDRDYGTLKILDEPCVINGQDFVGANLYITSNEEIQIDEWCFEIYNRESTAVAPRFIDENNNTWWLRQINMSVSADDANCKKIILTTDVRLIKDGVQAIDDEFLDWFIKNQKREIPIITTIVNNESHYTTNIGFESGRKEESEQETLEEAAERFFNNTKFRNYRTFFCEGAKWQQERIYDEKWWSDLSDRFYESKLVHDYKDGKIDYRSIRNWFINQFKKNSNGNK